jgi:hypothetical protein
VFNLVSAAKGLTIANVLVIALLVIIAVPVYVIYRALNDEKIMDRLMSTYEEIGTKHSGCTLRHVQERGGPDLWGLSSGFAFQGSDRWYVNVVLAEAPTDEQIASHCAALKLIADRMLDRGGDPGGDGATEVLPGSVPGAPPDGGERYWDLPSPPRAPSPTTPKEKR